MAMSSWKRSLHAYGMNICEISVLLRQPRHSKVPLFKFAIAIMPQLEGGQRGGGVGMWEGMDGWGCGGRVDGYVSGAGMCGLMGG